MGTEFRLNLQSSDYGLHEVGQQTVWMSCIINNALYTVMNSQFFPELVEEKLSS